jgi:hypothetical protein
VASSAEVASAVLWGSPRTAGAAGLDLPAGARQGCAVIAASTALAMGALPAGWRTRVVDVVAWGGDLTMGDVLGAAGSGLVFALAWWPFVAAGVVGAWLVFDKSGRPGWTCLVPVYNGIQFLRVAKLPGWLVLALFAPGVNVVVFAWACHRLARAFGMDRGFALGLVLLPPVFMALLGIGPARYRRYEVIRGGLGPSDPAAATALLRVARSRS